MIGFTFYLFFVFMITAIRSAVRHHHDINGDLFRDLMACLFFYPFTLVQVCTEQRTCFGELRVTEQRCAHGVICNAQMYHQVQTTRELKDK